MEMLSSSLALPKSKVFLAVPRLLFYVNQAEEMIP